MLSMSQLHGFNVVQETSNNHSVQYTCDVGGVISGDSLQTVASGEDATPVSVAISNLTLGFLEWSDHDQSYPTRQDLNVTTAISVNAELVSKGSNWPTTFIVSFKINNTNRWAVGNTLAGTTVDNLTTYVNSCTSGVPHLTETCRWDVYNMSYYPGIDPVGFTYNTMIYETESTSYKPTGLAGDYYCLNTLQVESGTGVLMLHNMDSTVYSNGTCYVASGTMYYAEITAIEAMTYFNLPTIILQHAATSTKRVYELTSASYGGGVINGTYTRKDN